VQEEAFVDVHDKVALLLLATLTGPSEPFIFRSTVKSFVTPTLTLFETLPPGPVQVMVYVCEDVISDVEIEPLVPLEPVHPPDAVQEVAFSDVQVKATEELLEIVNGPSEPFAFRSTVGKGVQDTVSVVE